MAKPPYTTKNTRLATALTFVVNNVLRIPQVVNVRLGKQIPRFGQQHGINNTYLFWWQRDIEDHQVYENDGQATIITADLIGQAWKQYNYLQLSLALESTITLDDCIENADADALSARADASGRSDATDPERLSVIEEGSEESLSVPVWCDEQFWTSATQIQRREIVKADTAMAMEASTATLGFTSSPDDSPNAHPHTDPHSAFFLPRDPALQNKNRITECVYVQYEAPPKPQPESTVQLTMDLHLHYTTFNADSTQYGSIDDVDNNGNPYVEMLFPGDTAKLLVDEEPPEGYVATLQVFLVPLQKAAVTRDTDLLTDSDYTQYHKEVLAALIEELGIWIQHACFHRRPRAGARNILDVRWVGKWKFVKAKDNPNNKVRIIRMRMTLRGFKDMDANDLVTFAGTSSRISKRLVVSESVVRGFIMAALDMKKTFLRAPLDFTRISSNFNLRRMHPIHKKIIAHRGVDYVAPRGTPIFAVGDGKIIASNYSKANGNYIFIKHGNGITTKYLHLQNLSLFHLLKF